MGTRAKGLRQSARGRVRRWIASGVIIAPLGTRGKVLEVGPDWLRVTFGLGDGVYFKTDTSQPYDQYWLATKAEGKRYEILFGRDAFLLMSAKSWERFVATRTHAPGARGASAPAAAPV